MGVFAHRVGHAWEQALQMQHEHYGRLEVAQVVKTYPSTMTVAEVDVQDGETKRRVFHKASGLPDYVGVIKGGRAILFEAKSWRAENRHRHRKAVHQAVSLSQWAKLGALCGYLVEWRTKAGREARWYWIDHLDIAMDEKGLWIDFVRGDGIEVAGTDWWPAVYVAVARGTR